MLRYAIAVGLFCAATAASAAAATLSPPAAMTLPDAVEYALEHSSTVATQIANVTAAQHQVALQADTAYPPIDAQASSFLAKSANYEGSFAAIGVAQTSVVSQNTVQLGINNWNLTTGGFAFLQLASLRSQAVQAENVLANTEDQIATSVTNSFYTIAQRKAVVMVDLANVKYQDVLVRVAKTRERAGVAAGVDVLQAQTQQSKAASSLVADRAAVEDASQALAQQIGAPLQTPFSVPVEVPQPPLPHGTVDALVAIADVNRPDVSAAHQAVFAAGYTRKSWNVELFPTVNVTALIGNQFSPSGAVLEQEQFSYDCFHAYPPIPVSECPIASRGSAGFWNLQAISTFTLPLID
ncbi:MAG TPA: TolC family protein, partial [Candidatus Acidoferrales bacterium]|nr:TolC family protein [Candidatus Acidoferrales bacterium]